MARNRAAAFTVDGAVKVRRATQQVLYDTDAPVRPEPPPGQRVVAVKNASTTTIPAFGSMRITGLDADDPYLFTVGAPEDVGRHDLVLLNTENPLAQNDRGIAVSRWPALAKYDPVGGVPVFGDQIGPIPSSTLMRRYSYGYRVVGVLAATHPNWINGSWRDCCWVQPCRFDAVYGTTVTAITSGASGSITAQQAKSPLAGADLLGSDGTAITFTAVDLFADVGADAIVLARWDAIGTSVVWSLVAAAC